MLNEGYALYKSLERCGIIEAQSFTRGHRDVTNPGKSDGLIVRFDKKGCVARIEFRNKQEMVRLWTITKGNQNSFPAIKLQRPLWNIESNDILRTRLKELKKNEQEKRTLLFKQSKKLNITKTEVDWWQRLQERAQELQPVFATTDKDFIVFYELMTRFRLAVKYDDFLVGFLKTLKDSKNDIPYSLIENILIGNKKKKSKDEYRAEARLIFDVDDWDNADKYLKRVASPLLEPFIISRMHASSLKSNTLPHISGLSGKSKILINDKFPQLTLPIGKTYLFSAAENIPCLGRYGKISTNRFPVGKDEADDISRSLKGITHPDKKGKTWYLIPSHKNGKKELLVVYLENKPDFNANQARLLGGESKNAFSETTYEATSSDAIAALKGQQILKANPLIRMFVLCEADPGNKHVSLQRVYTISDLEEADKKWREAAMNIPNIALPFFRKEIEKVTAKQEDISAIIRTFLKDEDTESKRIFLSPTCPFPADLPLLTQKQWFQPKENDGKRQRDSSEVSGVSMDDIYDVFFAKGHDKRNVIEYLLDITLQCTQDLLSGIGHADHKINLGKYDIQKRFTVLKTISALSIYLYKLGIKKEDYMKDTFFYVGRFLSLIDTLHLEYCRNVRGGNIPPQLLGNAHLQIALDNPVSALDILSRRISIYQAWTRKEQGEQVKLARWAIGQIGKTSDLLSEKTLPTSTTSIERAQMLLGYLSRSESTEQVASN